jgi:hypothetical protein
VVGSIGMGLLAGLVVVVTMLTGLLLVGSMGATLDVVIVVGMTLTGLTVVGLSVMVLRETNVVVDEVAGASVDAGGSQSVTAKHIKKNIISQTDDFNMNKVQISVAGPGQSRKDKKQQF